MKDLGLNRFTYFGSRKSLYTILVLAALILLLVKFVPRTHAQGSSSKTSAKVMESTTPAIPQQVVLDDLPRVTAARPTTRIAIPSPRVPMSAAQYHALKEQARKRAGSIPGNPMGAPGPRNPSNEPIQEGAIPLTVTPPTTTYFYPTALSEYQCGFIPSDMAIAASPLYLIQLVNGCITIINPHTGATYAGYPKALDAFFHLAFTAVGDVRAAFDSSSNRFIVSAEDFTHSVLLVGVSATNNPTGAWFTYTFAPRLGGCADFPTLGQSLQESGDSKGAIYLGYDQFDCTTGAFNWGVMMILPKTLMYSGKVVNHFFTWYDFTWTDSSGTVTTNSMQPANEVNGHDRPRVEYALQSFDFGSGGGLCSTGCNGLIVWSFSDGFPASGRFPGLGAVLVPTLNNYNLPGGAQQPGYSGCINPITGNPALIDTGDVRITGQVAYSSGLLYAGLNTLNPSSGGSAFLWWQIVPYTTDVVAGNVTSATNLKEDFFYYSDPTGSTYYPAVIPDSEGNITTVFNFSDAGIGPSTIYMSRRAAQAAGTGPDGGFYLEQGSLGTTYCQVDPSGRNRWGDYTAGAATGVFPNSQWFSGQFSDNSGIWQTAIGKTGFTSPIQP